ncbi:MAG: DNA recombination protein RmuC [Spirochaetaceae bacterium]|nr:DNA recombination protein RmuC [Spirochaetaceae bacterium]
MLSLELVAGAAALGGVLVTLIVMAAARAASVGGAGALRRRVEQLDQLSRRLMRFEEALTVPRQRGAYGERLLEELLATWLPRSGFATQVTLPGGVRVDAMVRLGERNVAIDAKFPFEAVEQEAPDQPLSKAAARAITRHVAAVGDKYVLPDAGTYNFALLYVPTDALYLRCFAGPEDELLRTALQRRVVPVGPSGLYLYLHTVGHALRGVHLAGSALELADTLQRARDEVTALLDADARMESQLLQLGRGHAAARNRLRSLAVALERLAGVRRE